jgi:hypothetical protein
LLTHLDRPTFERALAWFVATLEPGGLLVATTHGRRYKALESNWRHVPAFTWAELMVDFDLKGFAFHPDAPGGSLGITLSSPSWVARLIETMGEVRMVTYHEAGWVDAQDVFALQKRSISAEFSGA